jgi:hypothetical protein
MAYDSLVETGPQTSTRRYLQILQLAARTSEARVNEALRLLLDRGEPIDQAALELLVLADKVPPVTHVTVAPVDLAEFDSLFTNPMVLQ